MPSWFVGGASAIGTSQVGRTTSMKLWIDVYAAFSSVPLTWTEQRSPFLISAAMIDSTLFMFACRSLRRLINTNSEANRLLTSTSMLAGRACIPQLAESALLSRDTDIGSARQEELVTGEPVALGQRQPSGNRMSRQCQSIKPDGSRCLATAVHNSHYCFFHDPESAARRQAARTNGGSNAAAKQPSYPADAPNAPLTDNRGHVKVALFDYDNDGRLDIFFVNGAPINDPTAAGSVPQKTGPQYWNRLYRQQRDGTFEDVTEKSGLRGVGYGMGVAVGDYDNDGYEDLYVTAYGGNKLYHNNGNGTFTDVTSNAGVGGSGWSTSAAWVDLDRSEEHTS